MKTTVINLIGGPGCGKSTAAAWLYADMKCNKRNVEMVREVAKKYAIAGHKIGPFEQLSILGEQIKEESALFGKVEYIVTDSPALLGGFYCEYNHHQRFMSDMVEQYYKYARQQGVKFWNYWIIRDGEYDVSGRFESEAQAKEIDLNIKRYVKDFGFDMMNIECLEDLSWEVGNAIDRS